MHPYSICFSIGYRLPTRKPDSAQGHQGSQHLPHGRHEGETFPLGVRAGPRLTIVWRARFFCTCTGYTRITKKLQLYLRHKFAGHWPLVQFIKSIVPDPESGAFWPLDPDPGSGIGFFRIPDPNLIFLLFRVTNFRVKSSIILWKLAQIFFTKRGLTTNFFHPSLLLLFLDPRSGIRDPEWENITIRDPG